MKFYGALQTVPSYDSSVDAGATAQVKDLQEALSLAGFDPGAVDGKSSAATTAALVAFQRASGLPVDGVAGPSTLKALAAFNATPASRPAPKQPSSQFQKSRNADGFTPSAAAPSATGLVGPSSSKEAVARLQDLLASAGYSPGNTDGTYSPSTTAAIRHFQSANGLAATGILTTATLTRLQSLVRGK